MKAFPNMTSNMRSRGLILRQCIPQVAQAWGKCSTTLTLLLELDDDNDDDPDTKRSATVALNVLAVISCYTKMYKKQKAEQILGILVNVHFQLKICIHHFYEDVQMIFDTCQFRYVVLVSTLIFLYQRILGGGIIINK